MERSNPLMKYGLFGWNYWHLLTHPWKVVEESYYSVKWFIQRGYRGYADCDVWSLDGYLLKWLPAALRKLKESKHGYPCDLSPESWEFILDKMIDGLECERRWIELDFDIHDEREEFSLRRRGNDGLRLFTERFHDLWD